MIPKKTPSGFIIFVIIAAFSVTMKPHKATGHTDHRPSNIIKIGVILAKTGNAAIDAAAGFKAAHFAADEINAQGGINGKQVKIKEFDNHSNPLDAKFAAEKAAQAKVMGVIGAVWSSHSLAMAHVLQKAKIPMISPSSTNPKLTLIGNYIFRVCFPDTFQGKVMSDFALNFLHAKTAVVLTNASSKYSMGLAEYFIDCFKKRGKILL
jgi:branched-chain amino acid transport system substrate-binding protein